MSDPIEGKVSYLNENKIKFVPDEIALFLDNSGLTDEELEEYIGKEGVAALQEWRKRQAGNDPDQG